MECSSLSDGWWLEDYFYYDDFSLFSCWEFVQEMLWSSSSSFICCLFVWSKGCCHQVFFERQNCMDQPLVSGSKFGSGMKQLEGLSLSQHELQVRFWVLISFTVQNLAIWRFVLKSDCGSSRRCLLLIVRYLERMELVSFIYLLLLDQCLCKPDYGLSVFLLVCVPWHQGYEC